AGSPALEARARLDAALDQHLSFARKSAAREYTESIGGAILVALLLRAFVFEPFHIPSGSMIPTLLVGDFIFVNKMAFGLRIPFTDPAKVHKVGERAPRRADVVGCNRDNSADSRVEGGIGQIPFSYVKGRASIIWISFGGRTGIRFERIFRAVH